jgi:tripartite-type tricarboxylate transporter receptor subunit TctC
MMNGRTRPTRRSALLGVAAALVLAPAAAVAQEWPQRQAIRIVVPLSAGSATDVVARLVSEGLERQLKQTIVVENRVGAGGAVGAGAVAKAEGDGYTLLVNSASHTVLPAMNANLPYDPARDFSAVIPLGAVPTVLVVSPAKGYTSLADFVKAAKDKPGAMNYGSAGIGNSSHLNAERFRLSAGFEATHVPFRGAPEALREVMAERIDFYFAPLLAALPLAKDGKLQILAVSGEKRASALPDVPTTLEAGYPNSEYNFWIGLFAPAATPRDIVERLHRETAAALAAPAVAEKLKILGVDPMPMTPAAFDAYVKKDIALNKGLARAAGIKPN